MVTRKQVLKGMAGLVAAGSTPALAVSSSELSRRARGMLLAAKSFYVGHVRPYDRIVEWINGNGTNLIDLGFVESAVDTVEITFSHPRYDYNNHLLGRLNSTLSNPVAYLFITSPDSIGRKYGIGVRGGTKGGQSIYANDGEIHKFKVDFNRRIADIDGLYTYNNFVSENVEGAVNSCLCGYVNGTGQHPEDFRFYSYKRLRDDTVINDIICVVKDGVVGAFDTVTSTFFPNSGSGEMSVGPTL